MLGAKAEGRRLMYYLSRERPNAPPRIPPPTSARNRQQHQLAHHESACKQAQFQVIGVVAMQKVEGRAPPAASDYRLRRQQPPCPARRSPPHPRIVRSIGVHGWATVSDRVGAQFVVPRFVGVDPAEPEL